MCVSPCLRRPETSDPPKLRVQAVMCTWRGAGSHTQVPCKNTVGSEPLRPLSSPAFPFLHFVLFHVCVGACMHIDDGGQHQGGSSFFHSWVLGIEPRSLGLIASVFPLGNPTNGCSRIFNGSVTFYIARLLPTGASPLFFSWSFCQVEPSLSRIALFPLSLSSHPSRDSLFEDSFRSSFPCYFSLGAFPETSCPGLQAVLAAPLSSSDSTSKGLLPPHTGLLCVSPHERESSRRFRAMAALLWC